MKSNGFWIFILGGVSVASVVVALILGQVPQSYARIYKDSELTETVNLAAVTGSITITVESSVSAGGISGLNVIEAERGRIRMLKADCPDGICKRQGWISGGVMPIVCLPNRVVITLEGGESDADVDAVVG